MLIIRLVDHQRRLKLTDEKFALRLGVSARLWRLARSKNYVYFAILRGAARNFPDLHDEVLSFLIGDGNVFPQDDSGLPEEGAEQTGGELAAV